MKIAEILNRYRKITVVGISPREDRPSHYVSKYMIENGYEIQGVNPGHDEILGRPCFSTITDVPGEHEIVAIFRSSEFMKEIVDELIPLKPKVLWIQLGIENADAEKKAERAGIIVVKQRCLMVEHRSIRT